MLGHRGSPDRAAGIAENTLAAFRRSLDLGADGVELDVRRSADGVLVVHHDPVVAGTGAVADLDRAALPAWIPGLEEVLEALGPPRPGVLVDIEIKNAPTEPGFDPGQATARGAAAAVAGSGWAGAAVVTSFWLPAVVAAKEEVAGVRTGILVPAALGAVRSLALAAEGEVDLLCAEISLVDAPFAASAHAAGLGVLAWTATTADQVVRAVAAGADVVVADDVADGLDALGRHRPDRAPGAPDPPPR